MKGIYARISYFTGSITVQALTNIRSYQRLQLREEENSSMTCEPDTVVWTNEDRYDATNYVSGCNMNPQRKQEQPELLLGIGGQF